MDIGDQPFVGSEALASGLVKKHQMRTQFRAVFPDVYVIRDAELTVRRRAKAAWLYSHREGVIAGLTASALHGAEWVDDDLPIELIWSNARRPRGLRTFDMRLRPDEFVVLDGVRITTVVRTAFDVARRGRLDNAIARLDALGNATGLSADDVLAVADCHRGARGLRQLRTALGLYDPGAASPKETWLRLLIIRAGYPRPRTQIPVLSPDGRRWYYLDMGWEEIKLAAEYDGEQHRVNPIQFAYDIQRSEDLDEVNAGDVRDFVGRYLKPEQRTIVTVAHGGTPTPIYTADTAARAIGNERLARAPLARDLVRVSIPEAVETTLDNGLTLLAAQTNHAPIVSVRFEIRGAGPLFAPGANPAVATVAAAMLREGTATRASRGIAEDLDNFGVSLSAGAGSDAASVSVQAIGLADTFNSWFPVVADVVAHASFPGDELPLLKRRLIAETQNRRSTPASVAGEILDEMLYGPDAAKRITPQQIESVTADQLRSWYAERYAPQNVILSVGGAVKTGKIRQQVANALGKWTKTSFTEPAAQDRAPAAAKVVIVDRPGSVQTALVFGVRGVDRAHPDQLALVVANRVLGGGPASRLFVKLREERGLTYGVLSQVNAFKHGGDWRGAGEITSGRIGEGAEALAAELKRIGTDAVPDQELDDAKRSIVASFAVTLEQLPQLVSYMSSRRVYGLSPDYWDRFPQKIMAITPVDIKRVGATYMDMSRIQVVAVGDSTTLRSVLEPFGQVTVVK